MKTSMKKTYKIMTALALTSALILPLAPQSKAFAAENYQDHVQVKERADANQVAQPLFVATPAIGATVVKPTQTVEFKLNPSADNYGDIVEKLTKNSDNGEGDKASAVTGYLYDGKTVIQVPGNQISFDTATNTISMKHDALNRYTQYAAVLQFGGREGGLFQTSESGNKYTDVVTKVDSVTGNVTLLGHGTINVFASRDESDGHGGDGYLQNLKVGDIVDVHMNHNGKNVHLDQRHESVLTTLFTTGSAIGEATHASVAVSNPQVSVLNGGNLHVAATDDYGDPATNATASVSGKGPGNVRVPSALAEAASTVINNGSADIALADHSAETVAISYTVQDNTYNDAVDTHSGATSEVFLPGPTAQIHVTNPAKAVVGQGYTFNGEALDLYGNGVADGIAFGVTPQRGAAANVTATAGGDFSFAYTAPTKSGVEAVAVQAKDSGFSISDSFTVHPGPTAQIKVTDPATIVAGKSYSFTGQALDKYGNTVEDGVQMNVTASAGSVSNVTPSTNGSYGFGYGAPTKAGAQTLTIQAQDSGYSVTDSISIAHAAASKAIVTLPATLNSGKAATITGSLVDQYGNPVDGSQVIFAGSLTGTVQTDAAGAFTGTLNVGQSGAVSATVNGQPVTLVNANGQAITSITVSSPSFGVPGQNISVKTPFNETWGMVTDAAGNMFSVTDKGVYKFNNGSWEFQNQLPKYYALDQYNNATMQVAIDKTGHLLIGFVDGANQYQNRIMRLNGSSWEQVAVLPNNWTSNLITTMYVDDQNVLYVGTTQGHIYKILNGSVVDIPTRNWDKITSIVVDHQGNVYAAGSMYYVLRGNSWNYVGYKMNWSLPAYVAVDSKGQVYGADYSHVLKLSPSGYQEFYYAAPSGYEEIYGFVIGKNDRLYLKYSGPYIKEIVDGTHAKTIYDTGNWAWTKQGDFDRQIIVDANGNIVHFRTMMGNPWWITVETAFVYSPL